MEFAVKTAEVATPLELVVAVLTPPAKVPLAPDDGAVKVTLTPLTGFEYWSVTVAPSGFVNAVLTMALCGVPLVAAMEFAGPAMLVMLKLAPDDNPGMTAVTVYAPAL
ncbi:MAG TPA: hypothetical protein VMT75_10805 [Candidatus Saccharimonadales bacterium]|nr:hypothetical protein [Candidatus Saccharimonadales bacterium]